MIKYIITCLSAFLVVGFLTPGFADEHFPFLAQVSKESVNVRAGPNTNFEKIDKLDRGTQVVVLGKTYEWYKIQPLPTTKAYIRSDYLNMKAGGLAEVLGNNVNIRCSANSVAATLGEVKRGVVVRVLEQVQGWCRLAPVPGTAAWVHQDFLKEISPDVPASLLLSSNEPQSISAESPKQSSLPVSPWVTIRGTVEALVQSPNSTVHYEIVLGDKSVFYLQDIPQIASFCNTMVDIDGAVVPDPQKKLMYPLVHVNKIALVL